MTKWAKAELDTNKSNPFTLTFAKSPQIFIERTTQRNQIVDMFNSMTPSNMVYMITGVRGTGKTVMLSEILNDFSSDPDWETFDLDPLRNLLEQLNYKLNENKQQAKKMDISISTPEILGTGATVNISKEKQDLDAETSIEKALSKIKKQGRRVFIAIDDASNTEQMRHFASTYQRLIRHDYPVYLVMTGIGKELQSLQDEKSLTFLTRAPKIIIEKLNTTRIKTKYQEVLSIDADLAEQMAHFVKGYTYGFQVLGYIAWNKLQKSEKITLDELIDEFDIQISDCSYDKIWNELSNKDKEVLYVIAKHRLTTVESIREKLNMTSPSFSTYRMRLIKQGIISVLSYGNVEICLPRFGEYVIRQTD